MSDLTTKANGANKVTSATDTKANAKTEVLKKENFSTILETNAEKRIKNLDHFGKICAKHNFLKGKADDLGSYLMTRDGLKETLIVENTDGQTFEISNSGIIQEILVLCQNKVFELLEESEKNVVKFII